MNDAWKLYDKHAGAIDAARNRTLMERAYLDRVLEGLKPGAKVLDLGCGAGEPIAKVFIDAGHSVTGVDAADAMLDICRLRWPEGDWICADMRALDLGRRFDAIVAWDSFFHLGQDDQRAMFARFKAHAAPGAALLFTAGPEAGEALGDLFGETLYHASLDPAEYRALLAENGFEAVRYVPEDPDCGGHTVWLAAFTEI
jgi:2-polyprenyl-3-methyl-5-hydroxy-6-metoxy-1,4-benzoquinol methylase